MSEQNVEIKQDDKPARPGTGKLDSSPSKLREAEDIVTDLNQSQSATKERYKRQGSAAEQVGSLFAERIKEGTDSPVLSRIVQSAAASKADLADEAHFAMSTEGKPTPPGDGKLIEESKLKSEQSNLEEELKDKVATDEPFSSNDHVLQ